MDLQPFPLAPSKADWAVLKHVKPKLFNSCDIEEYLKISNHNNKTYDA